MRPAQAGRILVRDARFLGGGMMRLEKFLKQAGDAAMASPIGSKIAAKGGVGVLALTRTIGMAFATKEVGEEALHTTRDLFSNAPPTTWAAKMGDHVMGKAGVVLALGGLGFATFNCAADTLLSAVNGYRAILAE